MFLADFKAVSIRGFWLFLFVAGLEAEAAPF
jgi:hypothetical protein